jgi:hypothetical protein
MQITDCEQQKKINFTTNAPTLCKSVYDLPAIATYSRKLSIFIFKLV